MGSITRNILRDTAGMSLGVPLIVMAGSMAVIASGHYAMLQQQERAVATAAIEASESQAGSIHANLMAGCSSALAGKVLGTTMAGTANMSEPSNIGELVAKGLHEKGLQIFLRGSGTAEVIENENPVSGAEVEVEVSGNGNGPGNIEFIHAEATEAIEGEFVTIASPHTYGGGSGPGPGVQTEEETAQVVLATQNVDLVYSDKDNKVVDVRQITAVVNTEANAIVECGGKTDLCNSFEINDDNDCPVPDQVAAARLSLCGGNCGELDLYGHGSGGDDPGAGAINEGEGTKGGVEVDPRGKASNPVVAKPASGPIMIGL